jgi:hypothetical protein
MSVTTPDVSTRNFSSTSSTTPTFTPPIHPEPNAERDNELLNYYFDSTWTTKDIAEHFKLPISVIAAWFQRPDIVALIDFITAANERRARDVARSNLPGTIDILLRISRVRNDDKISRAASSALIAFARGRANSKSAKPSAAASTHFRSATSSPPRNLCSERDTRETERASPSPGRDADTSPPAIPESAADAINPHSSFNRVDVAIASRSPSLGSPADLLARAGSTNGQTLTSEREIDPPLPVLTPGKCNQSMGSGFPLPDPEGRI